MNLSSARRRRLLNAARRAAKAAYAPYSKFRVGAAVTGASGAIYTGCNVENASYGLTCCAERMAIFRAVAAGEREIVAIAIHTPTRSPTPPCGACRQVINEFGPRAAIICTCDARARIEATLDQLLPSAFGPKNLAAPPRRRKIR
jgi:cytidine deaminase